MSFGLLAAQAHDFISTVDGQTLYFSVTDSVHHHASVTFDGNAAGSSDIKPYKGVVTVPVRVTVRGVTYSITGIGDKAFANSPGLTGIVMPGGLTEIGDFAFDGCAALESVVFPGNQVEIGEGAFFRCPSVSRITLGSDWTSVNLKAFSWSEALEEIYIPAKVRQIRNLKTLRSLKRVALDTNNNYYKSVDGLLCSTDEKTLYAVPRGLKGRLDLPEGIERVYPGAIADCYGITAVTLPQSLKNISYREFAELSNLGSITFRAPDPVMTAMLDGNPVFALKVASPVTVMVPFKSVKQYVNALSAVTGEYGELEANLPSNISTATAVIPVVVRDMELAGPSSLKGYKKPDSDK